MRRDPGGGRWRCWRLEFGRLRKGGLFASRGWWLGFLGMFCRVRKGSRIQAGVSAQGEFDFGGMSG